MALEFVPSAVIAKALVHDMVCVFVSLYAACPRCSRSIGQVASPSGQCRACGASFNASELQYKYRLQLQVMYDSTYEGAMLFDKAAELLLGVSAMHFKRQLLPQHPTLPFVLADLLEGLHVSFHAQRPAASTHSQYTKDLKIVRISPLVSDMLPKPAVAIALDMLASTQGQRQPSPDDDDTLTE